MEDPTPTIVREIDTSYIESVNAGTAASIYLIKPQGPIRDRYTELHSRFLKLYLYTYSVSDVSVRMSENGLQSRVEKWFSNKLCTPKTLEAGIQLHRAYISILQETGTIKLRSN